MLYSFTSISQLFHSIISKPTMHVGPRTSMASQVIWEWTGIQRFPSATQTRMLELLEKPIQELWEVLSWSSSIEGFLCNKTIDVLLYVDRLDVYRMDILDRLVVEAITDIFGKEICRKGLVVLTHAQLSPPDGFSYEDFFARRSEALLEVIRLEARMKKQHMKANSITVVLVENSGKCNKNDGDEKILPNGIPRIPNLVEVIADVVLNGSEGVLVDQKLIEGPNPNDQGKWWIPAILVLFLPFWYFK